MSEQPGMHVWGMRLTFVLIVCAILFFHLLPLATTPSLWVGPDLLLAFSCAWSLRRPEYVPSLMLAGLFLLADLLLLRPPGLWAALALLSSERLKSRARSLRDSSFASEWLTVSVVLAILALTYRAILMLAFVDLPSFGLSVFELVITILLYPAVVAFTHWVLGVRKPAPGNYGSGGRGV